MSKNTDLINKDEFGEMIKNLKSKTPLLSLL